MDKNKILLSKRDGICTFIYSLVLIGVCVYFLIFSIPRASLGNLYIVISVVSSLLIFSFLFFGVLALKTGLKKQFESLKKKQQLEMAKLKQSSFFKWMIILAIITIIVAVLFYTLFQDDRFYYFGMFIYLGLIGTMYLLSMLIISNSDEKRLNKNDDDPTTKRKNK